MATEYSMPVNVSKKVPGPKGLPLVGVLPMLIRNPLKFLTDTANKYGDVISLPVGPQRFYLLNHPDHLKYVFQENYANYHKGVNLKMFKRLVGEGLGTSEDSFWLRQRRLAQPAFHHQRIAALSTLVSNIGEAMLQRWQVIAEQGDSFNIVTEMKRLTQEIIIKTMFSSSVVDQIDTITQAFNTVMELLSNSIWLSALPDWLNPSRHKFEQTLQVLDDVVYKIIQERRRSDNAPHDLLTMLLEAQDEETGESMTDKQLRDEVMTIYVAGFETTANSLSWVWTLIAEHPEVERKLHEELDTVLGGRTPTFQDLAQLTYTKMVFEEAVRLYTPGYVLFRSPLTDDMIGGYRIPAGSIVILSPYVIHHNPKYWEHPERFDPERFSPERSADRPRFAFIGFGGGRRKCIGESFALMEAQLLIAMVAQRYHLQLAPGHRAEPQIALTLQPRRNTRMLLKPRSPQQ